MAKKLIVFDLDGTILNTLDDLAASLNAALEKNGDPARSTAEVRAFVGNGIRKLIERGVPAGSDRAHIDRVHADFTAHYKAHCADRTRPYPGVPELLAALRQRGCRTAVVSNKADYGVQALCRRYFPGLFDAAAGEREGVRRKPAPDAVEAVLRELKIPREDAVYVGDSEVDIRTAENARMDCVIVTWGFRDEAFLRQEGAERFARTPEELLELV